ncbi:adenine deaminase [Desulfatibacillum aliphaticivorans]|uniref:Adenine deaminase n=1 Tax=Desulfatibacillum aliphaticivorans TaxID=218208 RepID=ADEC_DESAL|nr:adenine deaminase [Desulfatibacillum aliphaticivorans]B8FLT9.1 RecName: Full=Adenine deaminase; Short=Adenase; Short=Adenine aminase [Desulfatibacillum aliphaticivorans]ACL05443.1 adenine deaminase [Desulfatibacillum aliphaticivorans]
MIDDQVIAAARGDIPCDLVLKNAQIVNVFSGEIQKGDVAVQGGKVAALDSRDAKITVDLEGRFLTPGLIDAHVHIESSMVSPYQYARTVILHGTTAVIADPHEIANVMGVDGVSYMIQAAEGAPVGIFYAVPSCVPATHLETAGASLETKDILPFLEHPKIVGLAEMMNFPGVIYRDPEVLAKMNAAKSHRKTVDGHAPGLSGADLQAYLAAGAASDHECTTPEEALEKLASGMRIMIRQGTGAKNLNDLLPIVTEQNSRRIMFCSDDRHPYDLLEKGHINIMVARSIRQGVDPVTAIRMASLNTAEYFGLRDRGGIAPGMRADLLVVPDLVDFHVQDVYSGGVKVVEDGCGLPSPMDPPPRPQTSSMNVDVDGLDFTIKAGSGKARIIKLIPDQVVTAAMTGDVLQKNGEALSDPGNDILKIAVVERHKGTGNIGLGFVNGFGLQKGALASSVAHDSHNIIVVGVDDADMKAAVKAVADMGGGLAAAAGGKALSVCPLPIAGLMSDQPMEQVRRQLDILMQTAKELGAKAEDPFMSLSFLALPVIPELKITDKGLVDVNLFNFVSLFE